MYLYLKINRPPPPIDFRVSAAAAADPSRLHRLQLLQSRQVLLLLTLYNIRNDDA